MKYYIVTLVLVLAGLKMALAQEVEVVTFEELQNKMDAHTEGLYVYNFWATWCKPCVEEMPHFEKMYKEYRSQGVELVFVSLDFMSSYERSLIPFVKKNNVQGELLLLNAPDYNAWIDKIDPSWSGALPATLLVDADTGKQYFYEQTFEQYNDLIEIIEPLIKTK